MAAHEVVQKAPLVHMAHGTAWACSPQAAELPSTAAVQESCEKGRGIGSHELHPSIRLHFLLFHVHPKYSILPTKL